jgi:hypothetical protein
MTATIPEAAMTVDDLAATLPALNHVRSFSAVDTAELAARLRAAAIELGWGPGRDTRDIEGICGLRRQLRSLAALVFQRDVSRAAVADLDTACRIVDRIAILAVCSAQADGDLPAGDRTRGAWLGEQAPGLRRLHVETGLTWDDFGRAIERCRELGTVTHSALARVVEGLPMPTPEPVTQLEQSPRSAEEVTEAVSTIARRLTQAAGRAGGITDADVATLDPAVAADFARELWRDLVVSTALYTALYRRGKARSTRSALAALPATE